MNSRRMFLQGGLAELALLVSQRWVLGCSKPSLPSTAPVLPAPRKLVSRIGEVGPLGAPDESGIRLPPGFTARVIARTNAAVVAGKSYRWHAQPDGGATFSTDDGGWIYVSNSEEPEGRGGVGAIRFDRTGTIVDAYPILRGTSTNCSGGPTPWKTWLSCEETSDGRVHECDPFGARAAVVRPALGTFKHEAVTVDPAERCLYLTEDEPDGCLYRFRPEAFPDLSAGVLEVAIVDDGAVAWQAVVDPTAKKTPTRHQVRAATRFNGGEGIWWHDGTVYLTTKGDDRIHALDTLTARIRILYEAPKASEPPLFGLDNITVTASGDVLVAEDEGRMRIVALLPSGELKPLLQLLGIPNSEITGPSFDPAGDRLYFSSQRSGPGPRDGTTFEVTGPFHRTA